MTETPVTYIAGVGKAKAAALSDLGIQTVSDLLHHYPIRYEDRTVKPFEAFRDGALVTARAVVEGSAKVRYYGRRAVVSVPIRVDERVRLTGIWFNQPYLRQKLTDGRPLLVYGRYDATRRVLVASQTEFSLSPGRIFGNAFLPVYRTVQGISSGQLQQLVACALTQYASELVDVLPHELSHKYRLWSHLEAVKAMHAPHSAEDLHQAHRRLAFEEFFLFQLQLQWFRLSRSASASGVARSVPTDAFERFSEVVPNALTAAQVRACREIEADLCRKRAMARLLEGDVGSGKTWVAFFAAYATKLSGAQSALMAPTEILAEQHFRNAQAVLKPLNMRVRLLTGSTPEAQRRGCREDLKSGGIDLLIGTHALITETVQFSDLGLVITDEQHRFGVSQRALLREKGTLPDLLMLTATPIPRTLALAVYGDLDVSVLDELPKGRIPVRTQWLPFSRENEAIRLARRHLAQGQQAYVVAPLVEASEQLAGVQSATQLAKQLEDEFAGYRIALLHGRMTSTEKDEVMRSFLSGDVKVLVSTTVIEVGIDVRAATVMLIYHAERFGLAQLHQLRGRIGRGNLESDCILLSDADSEVAVARLRTLTETTDGFVIANRDLELRGPGEFLGFRQSGLPEFTVGDLTKDLKVMEVARDEAVRVLSDPGFWLLPRYSALREWLERGPETGTYRV